MSDILFTELGFEHYVYWQSQDKKTLRKINQLLKSIERDGAMSGEGKPEKLKYADNEYSRRIDAKNRLVYEVTGDQIKVISCKGHYEE